MLEYLMTEQIEKIWRSATKKQPIYIDSVVGKQIAQWLNRQSYIASTDKGSFKKYNVNVFREFTNPIDGKEIASTKQLQDFEKAYGVKQCGNDFINKPRGNNDRQHSE